jgi:FPC/CPF motif-containing protein YcgG
VNQEDFVNEITPAAASPRSAIDRFIADTGFPCVGAKTALSKGQIHLLEAQDLRCPADDARILAALAAFIASYKADGALFRTFVVTFKGPLAMDEKAYEEALWMRLQALHDRDRATSRWDPSVSPDPEDPAFSLSLAGKAFYIVGMHPHSSRKARRAPYPLIVFNLHEQFDRLRDSGAYTKMRSLIRRRDRAYSGTTNPMLADFGERSEARQYSGRAVDDTWSCPFKMQPPEVSSHA